MTVPGGTIVLSGGQLAIHSLEQCTYRLQVLTCFATKKLRLNSNKYVTPESGLHRRRVLSTAPSGYHHHQTRCNSFCWAHNLPTTVNSAGDSVTFRCTRQSTVACARRVEYRCRGHPHHRRIISVSIHNLVARAEVRLATLPINSKANLSK